MPGTNVLVLVGLLFYVAASLALWQLLLRNRPPNGVRRRRPRWPVRLAKAVATLVGGAAAGAGALLVVATVANAGRPGALSRPAMLAIWGVGSVAAMLYIGQAPLIRRLVTRACLVLGIQGALLPLTTLVAFAGAGTRLAGPTGPGDRLVEVLGVRLVGSLPAVWIGVAGFFVGLVLLVVADRARRPARRPVRRSFRASRAAVISARARHR
jgi:hypothetical protein